MLHPQARHGPARPVRVDPHAGGTLGLRGAVRERPRHPRRGTRRDGSLLRPRRLDGAPGPIQRTVRHRHRGRRRAHFGPVVRGDEQHRPRQAQAADRHPERQRLVDLRERRLARPLAQPFRAPPDLPEVRRRGPQLLQAAAQGRHGVGARAQAEELGRRPLLPQSDLGRARVPLRRPRQRPRLQGARGGPGARQGCLRRRHARRHPRADAQGPRVPAGRAEPVEVSPAGHSDGRGQRGHPLHLLPGLREDAHLHDGEGSRRSWPSRPRCSRERG